MHSCSAVKLLLVVHTHPMSWTGSSRRIVPPPWYWYRVLCKETPAVRLEPVVQVVSS